jgi:hypothetical protein
MQSITIVECVIVSLGTLSLISYQYYCSTIARKLPNKILRHCSIAIGIVHTISHIMQRILVFTEETLFASFVWGWIRYVSLMGMLFVITLLELELLKKMSSMTTHFTPLVINRMIIGWTVTSLLASGGRVAEIGFLGVAHTYKFLNLVVINSNTVYQYW